MEDGREGDALFTRNMLLTYLLAALIFTAITLVMFWPITDNITSTVVKGGDPFQSMWNLWWSGYATFTLHASVYSTNMVFYPVGANLIIQDLMPIAGILTVPLQLISIPLAYNALFILGFVLSGIFMLMLAYYITGNKYASFIAGLVFAFAPVHISHAYFHLNWTTIEFIPLFILFFIMAMREHGRRMYVYSAISSISFVLLTFAGDVQQGILVLVFLFFMVVYAAWKKRQLINIKNIGKAVAIFSLSALLALPFLIPIVYGVLFTNALATASSASTLQNIMGWSNDLLSFMLPSYYNGIFHAASESYFNSIFSPDVNERVSYIGYTVLFLVVFAILYKAKSKRTDEIMPWLFASLLLMWLSVGPFLQIDSIKTIPGIYYIYMFIPLFNIIREPGRFDVMAMLCISIVAAFGYAHFEEYVKNSRVGNRIKHARHAGIMLAVGISILILIEYNGMPLNAQFLNSAYMNASIPKGFYELGSLPGNFTVLLLPDLPNATSPALYQGMSMYYQTAFRKPIISGYLSRENQTQLSSVSAIPLSVEAQNLEAGNGFYYASPISENYSVLTKLWLAMYNVRFIAMLRQAYNYSEQAQLYSYLYSEFGQPVYADNSTFVFMVNNTAQQQITAYYNGAWLPGAEICYIEGQQACPSSFASDWWFQGYGNVVAFVPFNATSAILNFTASGYLSNESMDIALSNPYNIIDTIKLGKSSRRYSVRLDMNRGLNDIIFYAQQGSQQNLYGLDNITISEATNVST